LFISGGSVSVCRSMLYCNPGCESGFRRGVFLVVRPIDINWYPYEEETAIATNP
jgi:hypothetical protein